MHRNNSIRIVESFSLAILLTCGGVVNAADIRLRSNVQSTEAVIRLGDVADIVSKETAETEQLAAIELGPAPANKQTLRAREIQDRLALAGVNPAKHRFSGPSQVTLTSAAPAKPKSQLTSKSAENLARQNLIDAILRLLKRTADADDQWLIDVELTDHQTRLLAATSAIVVDGGEAPWTGTQQFVVKVQSAKRQEWFPVSAIVKQPPAVIVATAAISRGDRIRAEHLSVQRVKPGAVERTAYQSIDEVVGREATRNIAPGQPLDEQYVRSPRLVKRGDVVDLVSRSGGVLVRTKARAREEGGAGDLVNVELLSDRRSLLARVSGLQQVEISATSAAARN